ncbi:hypothetical protein XENOCAPTIV_017612, partial [Xenoophorus captivus]
RNGVASFKFSSLRFFTCWRAPPTVWAGLGARANPLCRLSHPGDGRTLPEDGLLSSPKEKKSKRSFFSLRLKKKRNKDEEGEGFEELDSFSSRL